MKNQAARVKEIFDVLDLFDTLANKLYWVFACVNLGELSQAEAGHIIRALNQSAKTI